jgi:type II secretion system protein G
MNARLQASREAGFTLIELMIVVAIIGILTSIAIPLYADIQKSARISKVRADIRTLASALVVYSTHCGNLPGSGAGSAAASDCTGDGLIQLTATQTRDNITAGPFINALPFPPVGGTPPWSTAYTYTLNGDGAFSISAGGDGVTCSLAGCS